MREWTSIEAGVQTMIENRPRDSHGESYGGAASD